MKFPYLMLRDFVDTRLSAEEIGDLLTMAGFELEGIEEVEGDAVLDIKVMSNRGDGLSVFGLAREVLAKDSEAAATELYRCAASRFQEQAIEGQLQIGDETATIESKECRRFACRAYEGVQASSQSPDWMQLRLRQSGMRPISLLVDLTNYVMLELGQPLHAFDRQKLNGGRIVVRYARPGEKLTTLNGIEHELSGQMMICDAEKPVGVPGVMGGLETEVTADTTELLLESANFVNTMVRKTRKQLGLATEASYRFERSVDPDGVVAAIQRFTQLLKESAPQMKVSNIVDHYPGEQEREPITVRTERATRLLGMEISTAEAHDYLGRLGMDVTRNGESLVVKPPSWRPDIVREDDLIEEIGRVHGYDKIPERLPQGTTTQGGPQGYELWQDRAIEAAIRAGFVQCISHSLRDLHPLDGPSERVGPRNPASPEMAWLRNSVLPSLAEAAVRNNAKEIQLFELGRIFSKAEESTALGLLSVGPLRTSEWTAKETASASFFTLKGALEEICESLGVPVNLQPSQDSRLHPTRQAQLISSRGSIGFIGQIHPDVAEGADLSPDTIVAEIDLPKAYESRGDAPSLRNVSRFPAVRRDISVQISKDVPFSDLEAAVTSAIPETLERTWLFDVYAGKGIPEGFHSLAIAIQLRKPDATFTDEEANQEREKVVAALEALGATRR